MPFGTPAVARQWERYWWNGRERYTQRTSQTGSATGEGERDGMSNDGIYIIIIVHLLL